MRFRLLIGGVILVLLVLAAEVYLAAGGFSERLKTVIVERSRTVLGAPVTVADVHLSLLPPRVVAEGITLPEVTPWLKGGTVASVRVLLAPWALLTGGIRSLDIAVIKPHLNLALPKPKGETKGTAPLTLPQLPRGAWTANQLTVTEGQVTLAYGDQSFSLSDLSFTAHPDVTLRSVEVAFASGPLDWVDAPVMSRSEVALTLWPDHLRLKKADFIGPAGSVALSGEVRTESGHPVVGFQTHYDGQLADGIPLARRFGVELPPATGSVSLSGRLYGPLDDLRWDGELSGESLALSGQPREIDQLAVRLRTRVDQLELVHAKLSVGGGELRASGELSWGETPEYKLHLRADDVAMAWLLAEDAPYGEVSGEAHLKGAVWDSPAGTVAWRYRNGHAANDHPEGRQAARWRRLLAKLEQGHGSTTLKADGHWQHSLEVETAVSRVIARVVTDAEKNLEGEVTAHADDFADLGVLIGLAYVHGSADAGAQLAGTVADFRLAGTATLADGKVRDLAVDRLSGHLDLNRQRLRLTRVAMAGDGDTRLAATLYFPPADHLEYGLTSYLAANLKQVPLTPLVGLFYTEGPVELGFPVTGRVNLVRRPDFFAAWGRVDAGEGVLYEQSIHAGQMDMWIGREHMVLDPVRLDVMDDGRIASAAGSASLHFKSGRYRLHLSTTRLPMSAINVLAEGLPFVSATFAGDADLVGDFNDPLLTATGTIREASFYGNPVGRGRLELALSHWQLRLTADLAGPGVGDANPPARLVFYSRLMDDQAFALSVRMVDADAVPWLRGLLPEADLLAQEQLGADYGLSVSGRVSAAGTIALGPDIVYLGLQGATLATGGLTAHLSGATKLVLRDGLLEVAPMRLEGQGLSLALEGELVPEQRFDLKLSGIASARWMDQIRPEYGIIGGASRFNVSVTGGWDDPWLSGTTHPEGLAVAPPEMADVEGVITLTGDVAISGLLENPQDGTVRGTFSNALISVYGIEFGANGVALRGQDGVYTLPAVELTGLAGQLRVNGGWHYGKSVALEAVGTLELSELVPLATGLSDAAGEVRVTGDLTGSWESPELNGGADMTVGRVRVDSLDQTLRINGASMLLNGDRVVLDHLEGELGGGRVTATGAFDTESMDVKLMVSLDHYSFQPVSGLSGTVSGDLALIGTVPEPTLSGDLHLHKALFDRRMQWGAWLVDMIAVGQQEIARVVPFGDTHLSLRLFGNKDILVDNNLAKLSVAMDLLATGTLSEPGLVGRMNVRSGEVEFRDHVFELDYANLDFVSADRVIPYLDVLAHTTVQHTLPNDPLGSEPVAVDLALNGPMDQIDLTLSSQPDLPQSDLLSLLAVGRTAEELTGSGVGAGEATYLVTGPLQTRLEEQIHRMTGLDRFQVDPFYAEDATETNSARLTVGKKLFDGKGRITYSKVIDATKEPRINFSYRIGPRVSLLLEQDEEGRRGGEVRYRIRFR